MAHKSVGVGGESGWVVTDVSFILEILRNHTNDILLDARVVQAWVRHRTDPPHTWPTDAGNVRAWVFATDSCCGGAC